MCVCQIECLNLHNNFFIYAYKYLFVGDKLVDVLRKTTRSELLNKAQNKKHLKVIGEKYTKLKTRVIIL